MLVLSILPWGVQWWITTLYHLCKASIGLTCKCCNNPKWSLVHGYIITSMLICDIYDYLDMPQSTSTALQLNSHWRYGGPIMYLGVTFCYSMHDFYPRPVLAYHRLCRQILGNTEMIQSVPISFNKISTITCDGSFLWSTHNSHDIINMGGELLNC